ncbi:Uncharacterized protein Fot_12345 [Forsythia ovata]|uniref:Uncharacterized protein n=1 Tax=Forsythia ovata TaxID=205694 RepID=A0ABD1WMA0_9LAMI
MSFRQRTICFQAKLGRPAKVRQRLIEHQLDELCSHEPSSAQHVSDRKEKKKKERMKHYINLGELMLPTSPLVQPMLDKWTSGELSGEEITPDGISAANVMDA